MVEAVVVDSSLQTLQKQDSMAMVRVQVMVTVQFAPVHGQRYVIGLLVRLLSNEVV